MIRQLRGSVVDLGDNFVVIDVLGVGYQVYSPSTSQFTLGAEACLHTYLAVRENALDLYGFIDRDTLAMFELLIELPKIGPKSALQILTQADIDLLKGSIRNNDPVYLSKVSGIGKKSAEKIVTGLKDKLEEFASDSLIGQRPSTVSAHTSDTIDALISLGYAPQDARRVVIEITTVDPSLVTSAEIIKLALRQLHS